MGRYYNDFSDTHDESLMHWKYLRRYMKNGKWQYVYEGMGDSVDKARKALRRTAVASKKTMNAARDAVTNNVGNYAKAAGKAISTTTHKVGKKAGVVQTPVADAVKDHLKTKTGGLYGRETIAKSAHRHAQEGRANKYLDKTPFKDRALDTANYARDQEKHHERQHHYRVMNSKTKGSGFNSGSPRNSREYIEEYEFNTGRQAPGNGFKTRRTKRR